MAINILLQDNTVSALTELLIKRCADLKSQINSLDKELQANELLLKQLTGEINLPSVKKALFDGGGGGIPDDKPIIPEYNKNWTWEAKIKFILRESNDNPLSTADIAKRIMEIEPYLTDRSKIVGSLSATLSVKSKSGAFKMIGINERNESLYVLPTSIFG